MLLNNLHALRVHTQGIFEDMGGEEVGTFWSNIFSYQYAPISSVFFHCHVFVQNIGHAALEALNDFQANVLAKELQAWCVFVARR